ncbi:sigma-54 interaction domain-containing protein [Edaphobacillus lindanitolerans]|uniref:Arginine utilization regulatory protein n=1 Tax=Edaphobacillus lindanitolerans TaxID=550447 RepID=A0A1U7PK71_9BACI|nr:sigma 54-interacting transcriptional regulator [Edaphobacillus lindanitolerans]SIT71075.1 arginine utilization regulatory protein [Edaphobacillus lindanitolerans]
MQQIDPKAVIPFGEYDNVLVVDDRGRTLYYDIADLNILVKLGHRPEDFLGRDVTTFYTNLPKEESTLFTVLRTGSAMPNIVQRLVTKTGSEYTSKSSTYPIIEDQKIIGAIEFSTHFFGKDQLALLEGFAVHPMYRKNGTIYTVDDLISESPAMLAVKERVRRVAVRDTTVLLSGPTGTGKEVVAQALHNLSRRFAGPFVSVDCGAITEDTMEPLLFGSANVTMEGSSELAGLFEQAQGGTLFLDELNALPVTLQPRLLKAIEEKRIRRAGGMSDLILDCRIIASVNENPEELLEAGRLREDLYYRLAVVQIDLPPLKERPEDIGPYIRHFIHYYNRRMDMAILGLDDESMDAFRRYDWPGNVRELRNAVEAAFNNTDGSEIRLADLPGRLLKRTGKDELRNPALEQGNLKDAIDGYERRLIESEYLKAGGVLAETARRLGISKQSLKYKLDKYGLRE